MANAEHSPLISIIMAAYNRSNVLRYAIESILRQTVADWELLVVGDACTDDTSEVVNSFRDPRIRFFNLEENVGEQSGPNNEGFRHSRGRYIAYLSQDDLWFPEHLEKTLYTLRSSDADWVFSLGIVRNSEKEISLQGVMPGERFDCRSWRGIAASLWLLKREVLEEIGGWRFYRVIRMPPSQDLILRAWKSGKRLHMAPFATAVIIPSGARPGAYADRRFEENRLLFSRMCSEPDFREKVLLDIAISQERRLLEQGLDIGCAMRRLAYGLMRQAGMMFGVMPLELLYMIRYPRKGKFVDWLRERRGLPRKHR